MDMLAIEHSEVVTAVLSAMVVSCVGIYAWMRERKERLNDKLHYLRIHSELDKIIDDLTLRLERMELDAGKKGDNKSVTHG